MWEISIKEVGKRGSEQITQHIKLKIQGLPVFILYPTTKPFTF